MPDQQIETPVTTVSVVVDANVTVRTYSDGAIQRNAWDSPELAQEYANSVIEVEGL